MHQDPEELVTYSGRPVAQIIRGSTSLFVELREHRNPIYLSFSLLQLSAPSWMNSLWLLVTLMPTLARA